MIDTVSALFVMPDGPYPSLVADWWDEARDARLYAGPNPGVWHPPCARWGRFWWSDGSEEPGHDDGCFAAAIEQLRRWGGVLEHPEGSFAWERHGIRRPEPGMWCSSILRPDEWVATVDQHCWGHRARKRTWLVAVGVRELPEARRSAGRQSAYLCTPRLGRKVYVSSGPGPSRTRALREAHGIELIGRRERSLTPPHFAELLVGMAASVHR